MLYESIDMKFGNMEISSSMLTAHSSDITLPQSPKKQQHVSLTYHGLIQLYLLLQVPSLALGIFEVQGPHHPVVALLGDEAELPCFLMPSQSAQHMKISWFRSLPSQMVHLHSDGRDHPEAAMEQYSGRTKLVTDAIHKGIAVLKIFHIQPADSGLYHCRFQDGDYYKDTVVMLYIADMGSAPHFHVQISKPGEMRLECTSEGWFPLPKIQWTNSWGQEIPSVSETQTQDRNGLFQVTATLLLSEPAEVNMTCSVWNTVLNQRKEEKLCIAVFTGFSAHKQQYPFGGSTIKSQLLSISMA
ncbi:butyrophilin subfamily 1 member A1-like [Thomomys bottae]